jgi:hypothetical protein
MKRYIVIKEFADKNYFSKHYSPGDELPESFGEERLANIVKSGLAKIVDTEAGNGNNGSGNSPVTDIDLSEKVADILPKIKVFTDVEKLNEYLETEKAAEKPRETVIKAIQERLANIVK